MGRQFIDCAFKAGGRPYAYHNDGEAVTIGDLVRVEGRNGAIQSVEVVGLWLAERPPEFETKPILGLADLAGAAGQQSEEN